VSTKQFVFSFGIKNLASRPRLAGAGESRPVQKLPQDREFLGAIGLGLAPLAQQVGDEARQALVFLGRRDSRLAGKTIRQGNGHILHDANVVFPCFRVKQGG
jgi:hypothetical protein